MMYKSMKVIKLLWKIHFTSGKNIHVPYVAEVCVKKNRLFIIYVLKKKNKCVMLTVSYIRKMSRPLQQLRN